MLHLMNNKVNGKKYEKNKSQKCLISTQMLGLRSPLEPERTCGCHGYIKMQGKHKQLRKRLNVADPRTKVSSLGSYHMPRRACGL